MSVALHLGQDYSHRTMELSDDETNGEEDQTEEEEEEDDDKNNKIEKEPLENVEQQQTNMVQLRAQAREDVEEDVTDACVPDGPVKGQCKEAVQSLTDSQVKDGAHPLVEEKSQFQIETKQEKRKSFFGSNSKNQAREGESRSSTGERHSGLTCQRGPRQQLTQRRAGEDPQHSLREPSAPPVPLSHVHSALRGVLDVPSDPFMELPSNPVLKLLSDLVQELMAAMV
ncbi:glutamic acid-rich protein-like [Electrophorus electricus]|uniref:glutamic acid-rich protein-like n=1 Tax=Electrophorus electricus TaxID=8005 RepID=UPI000F09FB25|nr:glutamic acid-rich protein-like [Electrophorus electricus]